MANKTPDYQIRAVKKYQEKFNTLRSELVKLCPKSDNNEKK